jgi:hypothetical protein
VADALWGLWAWLSLVACGLWCVCRQGVRPEWEDPLNQQGGHWEARQQWDLATLDRFWTNLVLGG